MKRFTMIAAFLLLCSLLAVAQPALGPVRTQNYVPTEVCSLPNQLVIVTINPGAGQYQCINNGWVRTAFVYGTITPGHCTYWYSATQISDSGAACGGGGGGSVTAPAMQTAISTQTGCTTAGYVWVPQSNTCVANGSGGGTLTNPITFNNGGSGAASGATFDGSAARTISYNTVGADVSGAAAARQANLSLLAGTYVDGDLCTYASSGTLLNCNTTIPTTFPGFGTSGSTAAVGNDTRITGAFAASSFTRSGVVALWTTCVSGYLKYDGTCDTPSGTGNTTSTSLTTGYLPKASGANAIVNSAIDDGITTAATITSTEPIVAPSFTATGSPALTGAEGAAPSAPAAGKDTLYAETTNGIASINSSSVKKYMVQVQAGTTHQFVTAIAATGVVSTAAIAAADVPAALSSTTSVNGTTIPSTGTLAVTPTTVVHSSGSPYTMTGLTGFYWNNTASTYNWVLDAPTAGKQYCFGNYRARTGALTITSTTSVYIVYKGVLGTITTGALVSGGAAGDFVCLVGVDSTTYEVAGAGYGVWTNN